MEKIPYTRSIKGVSNGDPIFYLMTRPIPSSTMLMVQHTVEEDEDTDFDSLRVGYGTDVADFVPWEEHVTCVAATLYWQHKELHFVPEMHRVIFAFYGTTEDDRLRALVEGYTTPKVLSRAPFRSRKRVPGG
ncbi:hypothetical protein ES703_26727 [subsurface metagenome]